MAIRALGIEAQLFLSADKLRKNLEPSEYKHVVLGLIFLKYISDAFEELHQKLAAEDPEEAEHPNPQIKGVLPKGYARPALDKVMLGELIDLISTIGLNEEADRSKDILGRVYEYFLSQFAGAEGKRGGEFYTPRSVVRLLVEMLELYKGRVYDPCCGSGGMFVQSERFVEEHGGRVDDLSIWDRRATTRHGGCDE
jgi:type I restriction enzyme M protein